jgi:hypothetical protein
MTQPPHHEGPGDHEADGQFEPNEYTKLGPSPAATPEPEDQLLPGKLDKDQLDALRMELSVLSPESEQAMRAEALSANDTFLELFGQYSERHVNSEEISQRFITTDAASKERFTRDWFHAVDYLESYETDSDMTAFPVEAGEFVLNAMPDFWPRLTPQNQQLLTERLGNEAQAKELTNKLVRYNSVAHEISHLYEAPDLPLAVSECGAYYYGREVAKHDVGLLKNELSDARADFYKNLIEAHGASAHRVFFGTQENEEEKQQVVGAFTPEVTAKLFPNIHREYKKD